MTFSEILDSAVDAALDDQAYEVVPLIEFDGLRLDNAWRTASGAEVRRYCHYIDKAYRRLNERDNTNKRLCAGG